MKRAVSVLLILLPFVAWAAIPGHPSGIEELRDLTSDPAVTVRWYDVEGSTAQEIRASMERRGPLDRFGVRRDAFTRWHVSWWWPFRSGKPAFGGTRSEYRATVWLPRLVQIDSLEPDLAASWRKFLRAVVRHELDHLRHVQTRYERIAKAIRTAAEDDPRLTPQAANSIAEEIVESIQELDRELDAQTEHGRRTGVRFP